MGDGWYTTSGASCELTVPWRDDGRYVAETAADGDVKCFLPNDVSLQRSDSPQVLDVRGGKFIWAVGRGPNYLFLVRIDDAGVIKGTATDSPDGLTSEKPTPNTTNERHQTDDRDPSERTMLDKIAQEKIGDEEFMVSKEDADSIIGQAKKRARSQGRDPAIDPAFQYTDAEDEENDEDD